MQVKGFTKKNHRDFKGVIFDMDGVISDTRHVQAISASWKQVLDSFLGYYGSITHQNYKEFDQEDYATRYFMPDKFFQPPRLWSIS